MMVTARDTHNHDDCTSPLIVSLRSGQSTSSTDSASTGASAVRGGGSQMPKIYARAYMTSALY